MSILIANSPRFMKYVQALVDTPAMAYEVIEGRRGEGEGEEEKESHGRESNIEQDAH